VVDVDNHPDWLDFVKAIQEKLGTVKPTILIDMDDVTRALRVAFRHFQNSCSLT
jgi:hypothetical protein